MVPLNPSRIKHGNAHTRYTIRTRTRKKYTCTRERIIHAYAIKALSLRTVGMRRQAEY